MKKIPIVALCGFLGSGKTTLLRHWRFSSGAGDSTMKNAAYLVHDLSEQGIDAALLCEEETIPKAGNIVGRLAALHGCFTDEKLHQAAEQALQQLQNLQPRPSLLISESTGVAHPWPLINALSQNKHYYLRHFIVTVDALNLHRDFDDGRALLGGVDQRNHSAQQQAARILVEQLAFANIVILTKVDMVSIEMCQQQLAVLQQLQPQATIALSAHAGIELTQLDSVPPLDDSLLQQQAKMLNLTNNKAPKQQAGTVKQVAAEIFRDIRPFHPKRLHEVIQNDLGTGLYRTKGYLWMASRPAHALLWQQSGSQISLELSGLWRAELVKNPDRKLYPEEINALKLQLKRQHPLFGDRHNELTVIGLDYDRRVFMKALESAICTEEEILHWQNGQAFSDPWPKSLRKSDTAT